MDPTFPALRDTKRIQPGEEAVITYDADDITFSELVVEANGLAVPGIVPAEASTAPLGLWSASLVLLRSGFSWREAA